MGYNYFSDRERIIDSALDPFAPETGVTEEEAFSIFEKSPSEGPAIDDFGSMQTRSQAMGTVLTWIDEKDFSYDALDSLAQGMADLDGDGELDDEELEELDDLLDSIVDAFVALGADKSNVETFIEGADDAEGKKLGEYLAGKLENIEDDDDMLVSRFAVGRSLITEAAKKKVIRDGKVKWVKKKKKKKRLSAAQRQALKKARRKAHTGAARKNRAKSRRQRKSRGM